MMDDGENFPEPETRADRIAAKAVELLEVDQWDTVTDNWLCINGVQFRLKDDEFSIRIEGQDASILSKSTPSGPFRDALRAAYSDAMFRKREALLEADEAHLNDPSYATKTLAGNVSKVVGIILAICALGYLGAGGIRSCAASSERAALARANDLNQVNEYGYRKGDFAEGMRWEYPSSCHHADYNWTSTPDRCRANLQKQERLGVYWVTWENEEFDQ